MDNILQAHSGIVAENDGNPPERKAVFFAIFDDGVDFFPPKRQFMLHIGAFAQVFAPRIPQMGRGFPDTRKVADVIVDRLAFGSIERCKKFTAVIFGDFPDVTILMPFGEFAETLFLRRTGGRFQFRSGLQIFSVC